MKIYDVPKIIWGKKKKLIEEWYQKEGMVKSRILRG